MSSIRQYHSLVKIELLHDYYKELFSRDFLIKPTQECQKKLTNYGLLLKSRELGRYDVLIEKSGVDRNSLAVTRPITTPIKLSFSLCIQNPFLKNITNFKRSESTEPDELALDGNTIYYFSNLEGQTNKILGIETGQALLSKWGFVRQYDQIRILRPTFSSTADELKLLSMLPSNPDLQPVYTMSKKPGQTLIQVDLRSLEPGRYLLQLLENGVSTQYYAYLDPNVLASSVFGIIDIYLDASVKPSETIQYALQFERRRSKWVYVVVDSNGLVDENVSNPITYTSNPASPFPSEVAFSRKLPSELGFTLEEISAYYPAKMLTYEADQELPLAEFNPAKLTLQMLDSKSRVLPLLSKQSIDSAIFIHL